MMPQEPQEVNGSVDWECGIEEVLCDLAPMIVKLRADVTVLRQGSAAMFHALQQIKFFAQNNGSIQFEKVLEIMKKNGLLDAPHSTGRC